MSITRALDVSSQAVSPVFTAAPLRFLGDLDRVSWYSSDVAGVFPDRTDVVTVPGPREPPIKEPGRDHVAHVLPTASGGIDAPVRAAGPGPIPWPDARDGQGGHRCHCRHRRLPGPGRVCRSST